MDESASKAMLIAMYCLAVGAPASIATACKVRRAEDAFRDLDFFWFYALLIGLSVTSYVVLERAELTVLPRLELILIAWLVVFLLVIESIVQLEIRFNKISKSQMIHGYSLVIPNSTERNTWRNQLRKLVTVISLIVIAVFEELLFRGVIYSDIKALKFISISNATAIAIQAIVYSISHSAFGGRTVLYRFVLGIVLGMPLMFLETVFISIAGHIYFNIRSASYWL